MEQLPHRVDALTTEWPSNLISLEQAAPAISISCERLQLLADGGFAPHYRIDGGPPMFRVAELRRWAGANLVEQVEGRELPAPIRVITAAPRILDYRKVPTGLREVIGLCDVTDEIKRTGIYFLCRDGCLLYVGQSINVAARVTEHYRRYEFDSVLFLPWPGDDLNRIEAALIRELRPPLNGKSANGKMIASRSEIDALTIASITNSPQANGHPQIPTLET